MMINFHLFVDFMMKEEKKEPVLWTGSSYIFLCNRQNKKLSFSVNSFFFDSGFFTCKTT